LPDAIEMGSRAMPTHQSSLSSRTLAFNPINSRHQTYIYCNPCLGIGPIEVESTHYFFGFQLAVGVASMLALWLMS
jgi:hypothetical protein